MDAKLKGKTQVMYYPIMIRFALMLRSKMNVGTYEFVVKVFNLPSSRSVSNYNSINRSSKDGVMLEVVRILGKKLTDAMKIAKESGRSNKMVEWMCRGSLAFDSMSIITR